MSDKPRYERVIKCVCGFCGFEFDYTIKNSFRPSDDKVINKNCCKRCFAGQESGKVRFGAPERGFASEYALKTLTFGEIYTIQKIKSYQHHAAYILKDFPKEQFHTMMFVPLSFDHQLRVDRLLLVFTKLEKLGQIDHLKIIEGFAEYDGALAEALGNRK